MSTRIGISVTSETCSAIAVRGHRIRWSRRVVRESNEPVAKVIAELLMQAPLRSGARVAVALGASSCQLKRIHGLPSSLRRDVADRVVRENSASFFLRMSSRLVTTRVQRGADGSAWCAALDGALVDEVIDALRAARLEPHVFLAEPLAIAQALPPGSHRVADGDVLTEFTTTDRREFTDVRRRACASSDPATTERLEAFTPSVRALGEDGCFYLSACGAAMYGANGVLGWWPPLDPSVTRRRRHTRTSLVAAVFACSLVALLIAPGVRASMDAARSMRSIARLRSSAAEATRVEEELRRVTAALDHIDRFASRRGDVPILVAELAATLPESTALVSARIDTVEVNLSVLTPRAADVVSALATAHGVVSPRIVGSVMRDASAREPLERAMVRFRRLRR